MRLKIGDDVDTWGYVGPYGITTKAMVLGSWYNYFIGYCKTV